MLKERIENILNEQVEKEAYSSALYLAMASWCEKNGYAGIAEWMYAQSEEERMHMLKFIKYINERGGHAIVPALKQPPVNQQTVKAMFEDVLKHEQYISDSINQIVGLAIEERDFTTNSWIQWFVNEQIEEEASVSLILDKLNMLGANNMYLFDRDIMGLRANENSEGA
ncbi:MAG: ferritin [Bacteroidales bacterium]|nr:ferritin [Bacteroidales bacterium]